MRALIAIAIGLGACTIERTPFHDCVDDGQGCCANEDCGANAVCDFDYRCEDRLDGGLACTQATGDQECHPTCIDGRCPAGMECHGFEQTQGTGESRIIWACF